MKFNWKKLTDKQKTMAVVGVGAVGGLVVLARGRGGGASVAAGKSAQTYSIPASAGGGGDLLDSSGPGYNRDASALTSIIADLSAQLAALPTMLAASQVATSPVAGTTIATPTVTTTSSPATLTRDGWKGSFADLVNAVSSGQLFANVPTTTEKAAIVQDLGQGGSLADALSAGRYAGQAEQWYTATGGSTGEVLWTAPTANPVDQGVISKLKTIPE